MNHWSHEERLARATMILRRQRRPDESAEAFVVAAEEELNDVEPFTVEASNEGPVFARLAVFPPGAIRWVETVTEAIQRLTPARSPRP